MRAIHLVRLDKVRPAVLLTREELLPHLNQVTVAPITSRVRGIRSELPLGRANGLDHDSAVNCDGIATVERSALGPQIGWLLPSQERELHAAIVAAFALEA